MILYRQIFRCPSIGHYTECNLIIFFKWHLNFFTCVNLMKFKPSFISWCRLKSLYIVLIGCTYTQPGSPQLLSEGSDIPISSPLPIDDIFFDYTQAYITIFFLWTDYIYIYKVVQNMTRTDLYVNNPHGAAAVRPWESEATTSTLPPARVRTCSVLSGSC